MTLQNFLTEHKSKLKTTKKLIVRDLDEIEKNTFVAYVDEGDDSYDVQIVFDSKKNIKETSCDCVDGGTCNHIIALANFISENKTEKAVVKKTIKRKLTETDLILETISNDDLKLWISETLNKNKELAFAFKNQFSSKNLEVTKENIEKVIQESISSVIGKRKKCETNEVKKIVDALNISLKPILEIVFSKVNKENYNLLKIIVNNLEEFNYNYYLTSNRVLKLIENLYDLQLKSLFNIKDIEEWQKASKFYNSLIFEEKFMLSDLHFIEKMYEFSKTNDLQNKFIVNTLEENFNILYKELDKNFVLNFEIEKFFLKIFSENKLTEKYILKFKPRRFQNEHNLILINELIKLNKIDLVEKYCLEQIDGNYKQEYDIQYVKVLISIYKQNNETQKLANILSEYGKFMYNIEDYLFIKEHAELEKFKKYRISVMTNARNAYQKGDIDAFDFYFELKKLDKKQDDLFEMLINSNQIKILNKYKEIAFNLNSNKLLNTIKRISFYDKIEKEVVKEIIDFLLTKYDNELLKNETKIIRYNYYNPIFQELRTILNQ
jgi:hypothetical protein